MELINGESTINITSEQKALLAPLEEFLRAVQGSYSKFLDHVRSFTTSLQSNTPEENVLLQGSHKAWHLVTLTGTWDKSHLSIVHPPDVFSDKLGKCSKYPLDRDEEPIKYTVKSRFALEVQYRQELLELWTDAKHISLPQMSILRDLKALEFSIFVLLNKYLWEIRHYNQPDAGSVETLPPIATTIGNSIHNNFVLGSQERLVAVQGSAISDLLNFWKDPVERIVENEFLFIIHGASMPNFIRNLQERLKTLVKNIQEYRGLFYVDGESWKISTSLIHMLDENYKAVSTLATRSMQSFTIQGWLIRFETFKKKLLGDFAVKFAEVKELIDKKDLRGSSIFLSLVLPDNLIATTVALTAFRQITIRLDSLQRPERDCSNKPPSYVFEIILIHFLTSVERALVRLGYELARAVYLRNQISISHQPHLVQGADGSHALAALRERFSKFSVECQGEVMQLLEQLQALMYIVGSSLLTPSHLIDGGQQCTNIDKLLRYIAFTSYEQHPAIKYTGRTQQRSVQIATLTCSLKNFEGHLSTLERALGQCDVRGYSLAQVSTLVFHVWRAICNRVQWILQVLNMLYSKDSANYSTLSVAIEALSAIEDERVLNEPIDKRISLVKDNINLLNARLLQQESIREAQNRVDLADLRAQYQVGMNAMAEFLTSHPARTEDNQVTLGSPLVSPITDQSGDPSRPLTRPGR
jgi:hypothetical protein